MSTEEEIKSLSDDLDTMHGLKEEYRRKAEKLEARIEELEAIAEMFWRAYVVGNDGVAGQAFDRAMIYKEEHNL